MTETSETSETVRLSDRGEVAAADGREKEGLKRVFDDLYDESTNPEGFILFGLAVNRLMTRELISYYKKNFELTMTDFDYDNGFTGTNRLHAALAGFFNDYFKPHTPVLPSHIETGHGPTPMINRLSELIANPGECILIAAPYYSGFDFDVSINIEVKPVPIVCSEDELFGERELEKMEDALKAATENPTAPKVAGLLLCNPHNPVAKCYPRETIVGYGKLCQKYGVHLISDELYACSVFDNPELNTDSKAVDGHGFISVLELDWKAVGVNPGRIHVLYGMSKDFGTNGFRIGVLVSQWNAGMRSAVLNMATFTMVSAPADNLWSLLLNDKEYLASFFKKNRRLLGDAYRFLTGWLKTHGIPYIPANAGHYLMADFRPVLGDVSKYGSALGITKEMDMAAREAALALAMAKIKIFVTPGKSYHYPESGWLRMTFSLERGVMKVGLGRIEKVMGWNGWDGLSATASGGEEIGELKEAVVKGVGNAFK